MRFFLFHLALVLLSICKSHAQLKLALQPKPYNYSADEYFVADVKDARISVKPAIGQVYDTDRKVKELFFTDGLEKALYKHLAQSFKQDLKGTALFLKITELSISEKIDTKNLISGQAVLKMAVYTIKGGDTSLVCKPNSSNRFTRSLNTTGLTYYEPIVVNMLKACMDFTQRYIVENKSKISAFVSGSSVIIEPYEFHPAVDTVFYQERKVKWTDFKGTPNFNSKYAAAIFPNIAIDTKLMIKNRQVVASVTPRVFMIQGMSWAKEHTKDDYALAHEQLHFDIAKLIMDELLGKLKKLSADSIDDLQSMIHYEYLEAYRKLNKTQELYDSESNHSINAVNQNKWERKVKNALANNLSL